MTTRSSVEEPRGVGTQVLLTLMSCIALGAGCSATTTQSSVHPRTEASNEATSPLTLVGRPRSTTEPVTGEAAEAGPVLSAWIAAEVAFESAARAADPGQPALRATTIDPELKTTEALVASFRSANEVARGEFDLGNPHVTIDGPTMAVVSTCAHDAGIVVHVSTGKPVSGLLGEVETEEITSTMVLTGGLWKMATELVTESRCIS